MTAPQDSFTKRIIMLCGSGGVGKTTISAAIALKLALQGKKVLVFTVDPARRLMDSLGIKGSGNQVVRVSLDGLPREKEGGELSALMLDPKRSMDELITKFARNEKTSQAILENKIYRVVAESLAGAQEYIALGKLYELTKEPFEHIVVDTAPTKYALDFFEAPTRLVDLLDARIIRWLSTPMDTLQSLGKTYLKKGYDYVFKRIENAIGLSVISDISTFIGLFDGMYEGFRDRAQGLSDLLKNPRETDFFVVAAPNELSVSDALYIHSVIECMSMPFNTFIINRATENLPKKFGVKTLLKTLSTALPANGNPDVRIARDLLEGLQKTTAIAEAETVQIARLEEKMGGEGAVMRVPFFSRDVANLENLFRVAEYLR